MNQLKFGVIGAGNAATFHTAAFVGNPDAKLRFTATYDVKKENAERLAHDAPGLTVYTSMDKFLKSDLDAVLICVPHYLHAEITGRVAEAGKNVICEKPMATTLEECDEMIRATRKAGVKFMIAENHRFLPAHVKVKELIDNGIIGDVYLGRTYEGAIVEPDEFMDPNRWNFTYDKGGGGVLSDQGVHKFAMLNWMLGEVDSGQAWLSKTLNSPMTKGEDNAIMLLRYKNGAMVEVMVSSTAVHPLNNNTEFHGTKGHIMEDHSWEKPIKVLSSHPNAEKQGEYYEIGLEHGAWPLYYTISAFHEDTHFAECIINDSEPEFKPEQAKEAVAVVLLGYLSAHKGTSTTMDELKQLARTKGTKHILQGLDKVVQKNYVKVHWDY